MQSVWQKWTPGRHRCLPSSTIASKISSCHVSERSSPPAMELIALRMASLRRTSRSAWMWGSIFCESGSSAPVQIRVPGGLFFKRWRWTALRIPTYGFVLHPANASTSCAPSWMASNPTGRHPALRTTTGCRQNAP